MRIPIISQGTGRTLCAGVLLASAWLLPAAMANAQVRLASAEALDTQLGALPTGEQLVIEGRNGAHQFAGRELALAGFSGVIGYSSQLAYVLVIEGEASIGTVSAGRGRMLLVPPFGGEVTSERFDAARLHAAFEQQGAAFSLASLSDLADEQARDVFLGRLGRTAFNVTTMGSAEQELTRRARTGGNAVRETRFAASATGEDLERRVVSRFLSALANGDAQAVADLIDPAPYGLVHGTPEASAARLTMARTLLAARDWRAFGNVQPSSVGNASWFASAGGSSATIALIPTRDFTFVRSIETEG